MSAAWGSFVVGTLVYLADATAGLQVIDVSNPASPMIIGDVDTPGNAEDVVLSGNQAYLCDGGNVLARSIFTRNRNITWAQQIGNF